MYKEYFITDFMDQKKYVIPAGYFSEEVFWISKIKIINAGTCKGHVLLKSQIESNASKWS